MDPLPAQGGGPADGGGAANGWGTASGEGAGVVWGTVNGGEQAPVGESGPQWGRASNCVKRPRWSAEAEGEALGKGSSGYTGSTRGAGAPAGVVGGGSECGGCTVGLLPSPLPVPRAPPAPRPRRLTPLHLMSSRGLWTRAGSKRAASHPLGRGRKRALGEGAEELGSGEEKGVRGRGNKGESRDSGEERGSATGTRAPESVAGSAGGGGGGEGVLGWR